MPAYHADPWVVRGKFSRKQNWNTKQAARASKPKRISKNTDTPLRIRLTTKVTAGCWLPPASKTDKKSTKATTAAHSLRSNARKRNRTNRNASAKKSAVPKLLDI